MRSTDAVYAGSRADRMDVCNVRTVNADQVRDDFMDAKRDGVDPDPFTTGATCLKSPMPINGIPPNGAFFFISDLHNSSTQSNHATFAAGSSSQAISAQDFMS